MNGCGEPQEISEQLKGGQHPKQKNEKDEALKSTEISWP